MVFGKGRKERIVYLTERAIKWIRNYLQERNSESECLFVRRDGVKRLLIHDLWRFFIRYREQAGLKKEVTAHTLRRTFATRLMENGADILSVSSLLGHANIETTRRHYIGHSQKMLKEAHQKYLNYDN